LRTPRQAAPYFHPGVKLEVQIGVSAELIEQLKLGEAAEAPKAVSR
jgi:hypothetical protein